MIRSWVGRYLALSLTCGAIAGLSATPATGAGSPESASFVMDRVTVAGAAAIPSSASYELSVTFGQEGPSGALSFCNVGFDQHLGFWSMLGARSVPLVLRAARDPQNASRVLLDWTGTASSFDVFRGVAPQTVIDPGNLALTTPACSAADTPPGGDDLVFYLIEPSSN